MTLGDRIKQRRFQFGQAVGRDAGFTQTELAEMIGVSQTYIAQAEGDRVRMNLDRMRRFAALGGMTVPDAFPEWTLTRKERKALEAARQFLHDVSPAAPSLTHGADE